METHQKVVRDAILDTDRLRVWYMKVARHRGTTTAIMATVGELLTIAYRLWAVCGNLGRHGRTASRLVAQQVAGPVPRPPATPCR